MQKGRLQGGGAIQVSCGSEARTAATAASSAPFAVWVRVKGRLWVQLCTLLSSPRSVRVRPGRLRHSEIVSVKHRLQFAAARFTRWPVAFTSGLVRPWTRPRAPALRPDPQASADERRPVWT